jgi:hypothetical protein
MASAYREANSLRPITESARIADGFAPNAKTTHDSEVDAGNRIQIG